ncbi:hypothetical protein B0H14DRAFT_3454833 [Mycena olivaceomarginata]|nr:hypothetical protein B0H14DRAFT_3454833 [Mycena olivaceomarginata]
MNATPAFPLPTGRRMHDAVPAIPPPSTPKLVGDLAAQHYPSILHRAGLFMSLLKSVAMRLPPQRPELRLR